MLQTSTGKLDKSEGTGITGDLCAKSKVEKTGINRHSTTKCQVEKTRDLCAKGQVEKTGINWRSIDALIYTILAHTTHLLTPSVKYQGGQSDYG